MIVLRREELEDAGGKLGAASVMAWTASKAAIQAGLDPHDAHILVGEDWETGDLLVEAVRR